MSKAAFSVAGVVLLFGFLSIAVYAVVTPVNNVAFHNSQPYQDGMVRDLENLRLAYVSAANDDAKAAIRATIQHRYAGFNDSGLPNDLRSFLMGMM